MFTVKTIIDNVMQPHEMKSPVIAMQGSQIWTQVADWLMGCYGEEPGSKVVVGWEDLPAYEFLEFHPGEYADPAGQEEIYPEEMITGPLRSGLKFTQALGILILDCDNPSRMPTDNPFLKGCMYQMIYPGDSVFVMNTAGATIHSVR